MKYTTVLFDLDGTLTDSGIGIINSIKYSLEKMKIKIPDEKVLHSFIGPPLEESFRKNFHFGIDQTKQAVVYYREYYEEKGMYENQVYEGIPELLKRLKTAGCKLYVATSKPEYFAKKILDYFQLTFYFTDIYGATMDDTRSKKGDVIRYGIEKGNLEDIERTGLMVGDRNHDIIGGKENHLATIGVLYGFGEETELKTAEADFIVSKPEEIAKIVGL